MDSLSRVKRRFRGLGEALHSPGDCACPRTHSGSDLGGLARVVSDRGQRSGRARSRTAAPEGCLWPRSATAEWGGCGREATRVERCGFMTGRRESVEWGASRSANRNYTLAFGVLSEEGWHDSRREHAAGCSVAVSGLGAWGVAAESQRIGSISRVLASRPSRDGMTGPGGCARRRARGPPATSKCATRDVPRKDERSDAVTTRPTELPMARGPTSLSSGQIPS